MTQTETCSITGFDVPVKTSGYARIIPESQDAAPPLRASGSITRCSMASNPIPVDPRDALIDELVNAVNGFMEDKVYGLGFSGMVSTHFHKINEALAKVKAYKEKRG